MQAKWASEVFSGKLKLPCREIMRDYINTIQEAKNPKHLSLFYPNGEHLVLNDSIAAEMDLLPNLDTLKQTDPDVYHRFWDICMLSANYSFKKDIENSLNVMNQVKSIFDRNYIISKKDSKDINFIYKEFNKFYKFKYD